MLNHIIALLAIFVAWLMGLQTFFAQVGGPGIWASLMVLPVGMPIAHFGWKFVRTKTMWLKLGIVTGLFSLQVATAWGWPAQSEYWGYLYCIGLYVVLATAWRLVFPSFQRRRTRTIRLVLIIWAGINLHGVLAFTGQALVEDCQEGRLKAFITYTAYQMACTRAETIIPAETLLLRERGREILMEPIIMVGYVLDLKLDEPDHGFTACLRPVTLPRFPYNLIFKLPFYSSNSTGVIRSSLVGRPASHCPPNGQEIMKLGDSEVQEAMERYLPEYQ